MKVPTACRQHIRRAQCQLRLDFAFTACHTATVYQLQQTLSSSLWQRSLKHIKVTTHNILVQMAHEMPVPRSVGSLDADRIEQKRSIISASTCVGWVVGQGHGS